jgi:nucleotide-binding universal stress UspA family protein
VIAAVAAIVVAGAIAFIAGYELARRARRRIPFGAGHVHRIMLPFTGMAISRRSLDAALRLSRAEQATLMPVFLATVPRHLPLDAALPRQSSIGMPVLEAIEQLAAQAEVPVDARVGRGRTYREALSRLMEEEPVDRIIISATGNPRTGLSGDDLVWLLENAPAEVVILRADRGDRMKVTGTGIAGHF